MTRYFCTYCKVGLVNEEQRDVHDGCGHVVYELEYLPPSEDHRMEIHGDRS